MTTKTSFFNGPALRSTLILAGVGLGCWLAIVGAIAGWTMVSPTLGRAFAWATTAGGFWHTFVIGVGFTLIGDYLRAIGQPLTKKQYCDARYIVGSLFLLVAIGSLIATVEHYAEVLGENTTYYIALGVHTIATVAAFSRHNTEKTSGEKS